MSNNLERLQKRADTLGWNLKRMSNKKTDDKKYILCNNTEIDVKFMTSLDDVALFLNGKIDKDKKKSTKVYGKTFVDVAKKVKKLGCTLLKEDWWDAMGKRKYYKVVKNDTLIRFITLIEVEKWYEIQENLTEGNE
jgi:hypothetical protein